MLKISFISCLLFLSCNSNKQSNIHKNLAIKETKFLKEITFQLKSSDKKANEIFKDGIIPWISIANPMAEVNILIQPNELVLPYNNAIILIDYPLEKPVEVLIKSKNGFSRKDLIMAISEEYHKIYEEEETTSKQRTIPVEERETIINRNQTDGKYGIWGHDIEDLDLSEIKVSKKPNGDIFLELIIQS